MENCSDTISGTHFLIEDLFIADTCEFVLMPGAQIIGEDKKITVEGRLQAIGNELDSIGIHVGSLISRTDKESFKLHYCELTTSEILEAGFSETLGAPNLSSILSPFISDTLDWHNILDTLSTEAIYQNESPLVGEYLENFDDNAAQGWTTYRRFYGSPSSQLGQGNVNASSGVLNHTTHIVCSGSSGWYAVVSPELELPNTGEMSRSVAFKYKAYKNSCSTFSGPILEYATNGDDHWSEGGWNVLVSLPISNSYSNDWSEVEINLEQLLQIETIRFRLRVNHSCPGTSCHDQYSYLYIDDFSFKTNYASSDSSSNSIENILYNVSSGGCEMKHCSVQGNLSFAGYGNQIVIDSCSILSNHLLNQVPFYALGEDLDVTLSNLEILGGRNGLCFGPSTDCSIQMVESVIRGCDGNGVIIQDGWSTEITNSLIAENTEIGLNVHNTEFFVAENNTIVDNGGGGLQVHGVPSAIVKNSILWGNEGPDFVQLFASASYVEYSYNDIMGMITSGIAGEATFNDLGGNINQNPLFLSNSEYHLSPLSPCIDAGDPTELDSYSPPAQGSQRSDIGWQGGEGLLPLGPFGCTDSMSCNYSPSVEINDFSCTYPSLEILDCNGDCLNDTNGNGVCDELEQPSLDYLDGFEAGYSMAQQECLSEASSSFCGPGTIWDEGFGLCLPISDCLGDLNDDGYRGTVDLLLVLSVYGTNCD